MELAEHYSIEGVAVPQPRASRRPWHWWLAWSLCGLALALLPAFVVLAILNRNVPEIWSTVEPQSALFVTVYATVGVLLATHRPGNALGWLFLAFCVLGSTTALLMHWGVYALVTSPDAPGGAYGLWIGFALSSLLLVPIFPLLLFPSGRLHGRGTRLFALVSGIATLALPLALISGNFAPPGFPAIYEQTRNPLGHDESLVDPGLIVMLLLLLGLVSVGMLLWRFRKARGVARQQYKWVVLSMVVVILASLADFLARAFGTNWFVVTSPLLTLSVGLIPVAMGIAILRYQLWDIDVIINRALAYLALSACIVGIYVFVVGWLGTRFDTGGNLAFSLLATAVVAILFQPLRERIQRGVNRLLYGERDEPYAVISRLGRRLEDTLAPDAVLSTITSTVREALKLPYSAIALSGAEGETVVAASGDPAPEPVRVPLLYQHEPVGELLLGPRTPGEGFSPADRRLLDDLARQAGIAVHAVQLTHELQQARERLVEAREEERRRLRRDLHDGLGSQLAALNLQAGAVRRLIETDPAEAQVELSELRGQLQAAIASIRTLVHGLRPPAIDELGLVVALRERVRQYNDEGLIVEADLPETLGELPAAAEVAVYRITEEALANVVRHAQARTCVVRLAVDDMLHLSIDDDGVGVTPEVRAGVGLLSMRERAEELGGRCVVEARPGGGTRVAVRLPLVRRQAAPAAAATSYGKEPVGE